MSDEPNVGVTILHSNLGPQVAIDEGVLATDLVWQDGSCSRAVVDVKPTAHALDRDRPERSLRLIYGRMLRWRTVSTRARVQPSHLGALTASKHAACCCGRSHVAPSVQRQRADHDHAPHWSQYGTDAPRCRTLWGTAHLENSAPTSSPAELPGHAAVYVGFERCLNDSRTSRS